MFYPGRPLLFTMLAVYAFIDSCTGSFEQPPRKPDPAKGTVSGIVFCTDTGKPARFAEVQLLPAAIFNSAPKPENQNLDMDEQEVTGLDGRFMIEAVPPGEYYAYATLNGYLSVERAMDLSVVAEEGDKDEQVAKALNRLKDLFVRVTVNAQHTTGVTLSLERAAEIQGKVTYDDSSPAAGVKFQVMRKDNLGNWITAHSDNPDGWGLDEETDGRGHYTISNLPSGEYKICALLPIRSQFAGPHFCLGGANRIKDSEPVNVSAGETRSGTDFVIPLTGLYMLSGNVTKVSDGLPLNSARVHLLYANDREEARNVRLWEDGSFAFPYVPPGDYILRVTDAVERRAASQDAGSAQQSVAYAAKEIPISVRGEMTDVNIAVAPEMPVQAAQ